MMKKASPYSFESPNDIGIDYALIAVSGVATLIGLVYLFLV